MKNNSLIQTKDRAKWIKLSRQIDHLERSSGDSDGKQNTEADLQQLVRQRDRLLSASVAKSKQIDEQIPTVSIPDSLPVAALEDEFIRLIQKNQVVILAGETGCGKTTQLPKLCLKAGLGRRGLIGHTQPRRVAATSVARRIAEELNTQPGDFVGYSVRFHQNLTERSRILLMTDGILLSELERDPWLSRYEVIIIDEAHERSLNIDFLLGFLKTLLRKRRDLKLIITSATIDPESFSKFFNHAPMLHAEGRSYPVEIRYRPLADPEAGINLEEVDGVIAAVEECIATGPGDILIFANGEAEIKQLCREIHNQFGAQLKVLPLYARLGMQAQNKVFAPTGTRKVVVSTNVAETSLTVPGIVFVIDTGTARISRFSQRTKIQQLPIEKISQASAKQRAGRCGRVAPGVCIRLYDEDDFDAREAFTPAEIQRTNLAAVVLRLKMMGVKQLENFPLLQAPSHKAWNSAIQQLIELGALDKQQKMTSLGRLMARIPADPQLSRLLVENKHGALHEMLIIAAFMSGREVRERPHNAQQKADQCHAQFVVKGSDVLTVINLWNCMAEKRKQLSSRQFKDWCHDHYLNFLTWLEWKNLYQQLKQSVYDLGLRENSTPASEIQIHRSLIPGFASHILFKDKEGGYLGARGSKVSLHPSSVCFKNGGQWMLSLELIETSKAWARINAPIQTDWIEEAVPHLLKDRYYDPHWRKDRGQACSHLDRSLFGLPVVVSRIVSCVDTEPQKARQLFLRHGLAEANLKTKLPFLSHNQTLQKALNQQEQAQRTQGLMISEEGIANLYDEKLAPHIRSEKSLVRWLKKDWKANNESLKFERDVLLARELDGDNGFPASINIKGVELPIRYRFAPGENDDGMTVCLPDAMIKQFIDEDFEWLVPGFLLEKIQLTLKSLKKSLRKQIIPVAASAEKIYQSLIRTDYQHKPYLKTIAFEVRRLIGAPVEESDFNQPDWPAHLRVKFAIAGSRREARQKIIYHLHDLAKQNLAPEHAQDARREPLFESLQWPKEGIPLEINRKRGGQVLRLFQALKRTDKGLFRVGDCGSLQEAMLLQRESLALWQVTRLKQEMNRFYKSWPEKKLLDKLTIRVGGARRFLDMILAGLLYQQMETEKVPQSLDEYQRFVKMVDSRWRQWLTETLQQVLPLLKQKEQLQLKLSSLTHAVYQASRKDIEQQLSQLWSEENILHCLPDLMKDYQRYQKGIEVRIKRVFENFPKEQLAFEDWSEWLEWWQDILAQKPEYWRFTESGLALYRMLENFRISLFSPGIKIVGGVSAHKLQSAFEAAESERT